MAGSSKSSMHAGFTLIEMLVVVAILGFSLSVITARGPMHSQTLEMQASVNAVAQAARLARSKAVATNSPVRLAVDVTARSFRIDDAPPVLLPRALSVTMLAVSNETAGERLAAIRFNGDGSATGGQIELTDGQQRARIGVDWLTGRVSIARAL